MLSQKKRYCIILYVYIYIYICIVGNSETRCTSKCWQPPQLYDFATSIDHFNLDALSGFRGPSGATGSSSPIVQYRCLVFTILELPEALVGTRSPVAPGRISSWIPLQHCNVRTYDNSMITYGFHRLSNISEASQMNANCCCKIYINIFHRWCTSEWH